MTHLPGTANAALSQFDRAETAISSRYAFTCRSILASAAASALSFAMLATPSHAQSATSVKAEVAGRAAQSTAIRPFKVSFPKSALDDLRKRVQATRWPDKETVMDQSQGVQLAKLKDLVSYWGTKYDWRKTEARLNKLPMFVTEIDGLDIQYIHVRSPHPNAMPLIITHGWPGSIFELEKAIGPLTNPTAFGGKAEDAFDVVIPSMPGYGFSERPTGTGWGPDRMGKAWDALMKRVGYTHYVSQGGDWGSVVADAMGRQAPEGLLGIHVNMPASVPADLMKGINAGDPPPAGLSTVEKAAYESLSTFFAKNAGYGAMMVTRPQTVGYGLSDSPAGLAAWMFDKFNQWTFSGGDAGKVLTRDQMLDDITLYWLTNSAISSARLYWENNNNNFATNTQRTSEIKVPVGVTVFPGEIYQAPRSWTERAYPKLTYFNEVNKGGHFAAWEQPELFAQELRNAFRSVRPNS